MRFNGNRKQINKSILSIGILVIGLVIAYLLVTAVADRVLSKQDVNGEAGDASGETAESATEAAQNIVRSELAISENEITNTTESSSENKADLLGQINSGVSMYEERLFELSTEWTGINFVVESTEGTESFELFRRGEDVYVFLPAYVEPSGCFTTEGDFSIACNGKELSSKDYIENIDDITLEVRKTDGTVCAVKVLQSENIAIVYIDTESGSMDRVDGDKDASEIGIFRCVNSDGKNDSSGNVTIQARGVSSYYQTEKKSYGLKFDVATDVLGMGADKKWALISNAFDATKLRNKIVYELAKDININGAVDCEYADVYFNGQYAGNYLITEKISEGDNRLSFNNQKDMLIELTSEERVEETDTAFADSLGKVYVINYPDKVDDQDVYMIAERFSKINYLARRCEKQEYYDILKQLLDIDSFAQLYIINQLTNENDINKYSMFYCYDSDRDIISAGPVWDFDRSFGDDYDAGLYAEVNSFYDGWAEWLYQNDEFRTSVNKEWEDNKAKYLSLSSKIDKYSKLIEKSVDMDKARNGSAPEDQVEYPDFNQNVRYLLDYLEKRSSLIQRNIEENSLEPTEKTVHRVTVDCMDASRVVYVDELEDRLDREAAIEYSCRMIGLEDASLYMENGTKVWEDMPIYSDITVYAYDPIALQLMNKSNE